jgi:hypothetical protein
MTTTATRMRLLLIAWQRVHELMNNILLQEDEDTGGDNRDNVYYSYNVLLVL